MSKYDCAGRINCIFYRYRWVDLNSDLIRVRRQEAADKVRPQPIQKVILDRLAGIEQDGYAVAKEDRDALLGELQRSRRGRPMFVRTPGAEYPNVHRAAEPERTPASIVSE